MLNKTLVLYVHGKGGAATEAEHYKSLFPDCDVIGLDYKAETPWAAKEEFAITFNRITESYGNVILIANSIGAYFSMCSLPQDKIKKAYFISPVVDMEKLIKNMMAWGGVTENDLLEKGEVKTSFGETLSWQYLGYVREHHILWTVPTLILYGEKDNLTDIATIIDFANSHGATLTVMQNGEHWFHTTEQMKFLDDWINNSDKQWGAKMKKSRYNTARKWLIFWTLFVGFGAVWGAVCMFIDPSGKLLQMDTMLPYFKKLPFADVLFTDYTFSGIALLIVNGLTNLTAAVLLIKKKKLGVILGGMFGVTLMLWICIQFYMFPPNVLSTVYFVFGFCQALTGYAAWVFCKQEEFSVDISEYKNIGTDKSKLVVYFSRMGYVKKVAYETANRTGADIYEIKATEKTEGTLGFWWCGRFGMQRLDMSIEKIDVDLVAYDELIVCSPVWVFSFAAPVKSFLKLCRGKVKKIDYILVHFTNGNYEKAARDADSLVGIMHGDFINVRCRMGKFKKIKSK